MNDLAHKTRTVSVKISANTPDEILAIVKLLNRHLPGVRLTTGIKLGDHATPTRFPDDYFAFALVSFELTAAGEARPTQKNAVLAFEEGRRP
jgi:hypothetical protein